MPSEKTHGPTTVGQVRDYRLTAYPFPFIHSFMALSLSMKNVLEVTANAIKSRTLKNMVRLITYITHMHAWTKRADTRNLCHTQPLRPFAHLAGQSVSTKPKRKQAAHASVTH